LTFTCFLKKHVSSIGFFLSVCNIRIFHSGILFRNFLYGLPLALHCAVFKEQFLPRRVWWR